MTPNDKLIGICRKFNKMGLDTDNFYKGKCSKNKLSEPYIIFKPLKPIKVNALLGLCLRLDSINTNGEKHDHGKIKVKIGMSTTYINYCMNENGETNESLFKEYRDRWIKDLEIVARMLG